MSTVTVSTHLHARLLQDDKRVNRRFLYMPYQLLTRLCRMPLPVILSDVEDIHKLRALSAAELVVADIPSTLYARPTVQYASSAVALSVTTRGHIAAGIP